MTDPVEGQASARLMDPASGDFIDAYLPIALAPFLHMGSHIILTSVERFSTLSSSRLYLKSKAPGMLLLGFNPQAIWAAKPTVPFKPLANRPPATTKGNVTWKARVRLDRVLK